LLAGFLSVLVISLVAVGSLALTISYKTLVHNIHNFPPRVDNQREASRQRKKK